MFGRDLFGLTLALNVWRLVFRILVQQETPNAIANPKPQDIPGLFRRGIAERSGRGSPHFQDGAEIGG
jgi:hypothetical protein